MTKKSNVAASVHQRLLNRARKESRPFNEMLQRFPIGNVPVDSGTRFH